MARLHEYQSKHMLAGMGIPTTKYEVTTTAEGARAAAEEVGGPVVIKAQVWVTGRAGRGLIKFAENSQDAERAAKEIFSQEVNNFPVEMVLVEQQLKFEREFYAGIIIDDSTAKPMIIFSSKGGSGIEEIAAEHPDSVAKYPIDINKGLRDHEARNIVRQVGIHGKLQTKLASILVKLYQLSRKYEARSAEINPLALTLEGDIVALDGRITIDDYAVFRHPELGIEIAREFGHPPTKLEKIAYEVENNDYRGTFFFAQMARGFTTSDNYVGFHGAGGGGSMMSMDAITAAGFNIANFTDTSGNPSAAKVYRAARIILSQPNIVGYFGSGSGVASQEQFHSAYGLAKAFWEMNLNIPAVIRLGGNSEDRAVDILHRMSNLLLAPVEGYKKDDTPSFCAERLKTLVAEADAPIGKMSRRNSDQALEPYQFLIDNGSVTIDHSLCDEKTTNLIIKMCPDILMKNESNKPILKIEKDEVKSGRFQGWIACEIECRLEANPALHVDLPIAGLE